MRLAPLQKILLGFLASVAVILLIALVPPILSLASPSSLSIPVAGACALLGIVWIIVGWLFAPSVEAYIGQGAVRGHPIIGPSFANPERSEPVMKDLAWRLSSQTDAGIVIAALGFVLLSMSVTYYADQFAGLVGLLVCATAFAVVLGLTFLPLRRGRTDRQPVAPPNP